MATKKTCLTCGGSFIGRADAVHCSPACRQRARRGRGAKCDSGGVTDTPIVRSRRGKGSRSKRDPGLHLGCAPPEAEGRDFKSDPPAAIPGVHCAEALALLAALDAELAENSAERDGEQLSWSAAEVAVRELVACAVDRKVDLWARYQAAEEDKARVKLSTELRLLELSIARLLKHINTDVPAPLSKTSQRAKRAAEARWRPERGSGSA